LIFLIEKTCLTAGKNKNKNKKVKQKDGACEYFVAPFLFGWGFI